MVSGRTQSLHSLPHPRPLPVPEGNSEGVFGFCWPLAPSDGALAELSSRGSSPPDLPGSGNKTLASSRGDGEESFRLAPPRASSWPGDRPAPRGVRRGGAEDLGLGPRDRLLPSAEQTAQSGAERAMTALRGQPEMQDTCTSLGLMLSIVLFMGLARVVSRQQLNGPMAHAFVLEFLATFQLCFCTHELQLLSEQEPLHPTWPLMLIYFFSLVHGLTLVGTSSNPCGVMMQMMLGGMSAETGAIRLLAQLIGALCSRYCMGALWEPGAD